MAFTGNALKIIVDLESRLTGCWLLLMFGIYMFWKQSPVLGYQNLALTPLMAIFPSSKRYGASFKGPLKKVQWPSPLTPLPPFTAFTAFGSGFEGSGFTSKTELFWRVLLEGETNFIRFFFLRARKWILLLVSCFLFSDLLFLFLKMVDVFRCIFGGSLRKHDDS